MGLYLVSNWVSETGILFLFFLVIVSQLRSPSDSPAGINIPTFSPAIIN